jgi:hypothetical protein
MSRRAAGTGGGYVLSREDGNAAEPHDGPVEQGMPIGDTRGMGQAVEDETSFPGLCRICGGTVLPASDPSSCTPSLCSEECLAKALVAYWATHGAEAAVRLRDGFARLEGLTGTAQNKGASAPW